MLLRRRVLVTPGGALMVSFCTVRLVAGVRASMVTVLVASLVMRIKAVISGGVWPDQLVPSLQKPEALVIQIFSARAERTPANTSTAGRPNRAKGAERECLMRRAKAVVNIMFVDSLSP